MNAPSRPFWFVVATDLALVSPIAGGVALLLRKASAVWLFGLSLVAIVINNGYDVVAGTSLARVDQGWRTYDRCGGDYAAAGPNILAGRAAPRRRIEARS